MTTPVTLVKSGMGIEEGTIVKWRKAKGDRVNQGEVLAEVETAKAMQEVEAPVGGVLAKILRAEGETVAVNSAIGEIEEG